MDLLLGTKLPLSADCPTLRSWASSEQLTSFSLIPYKFSFNIKRLLLGKTHWNLTDNYFFRGFSLRFFLSFISSLLLVPSKSDLCYVKAVWSYCILQMTLNYGRWSGSGTVFFVGFGSKSYFQRWCRLISSGVARFFWRPRRALTMASLT